ncbi:MAG: thioredoxin family protein, partial [Candidatus Woesearchaeota archaeon]|nr:thioredoxin family protein [Candidatus Woesearchaeota archaeon]
METKKIIKIIPIILILSVIFLMLLLQASAEDYCELTTPTCNAGNASANISLPTSNASNESICIYFFYGKGCSHCALVEPLIEELAQKYPQVNVKYFEVYFNDTNKAMLDDFNSRYGIRRAGIPAAFIGDRAFIGDKAISNDLEDSIQYFLNNTPICPEKYR